MKRALLAALVAGALVAVALGSPAPAQGSLLEASVVPYQAGVEVNQYPVQSASGESLGTAQWRVVAGTGNCCENFVGTTRTGRLMDFGGTHLHYSDDLGQTWKEVRPLGVILNGEGTVVEAPGGDVVGASWVTYDGDKLIAYKYDAATDKWFWAENHLHTPFFDRPWIATVKGPFQVGPVTVPYISILTSNFTRDVHYISLDGLNYFVPSTRGADDAAAEPVSKWLDLPNDPDADWTQPMTELGVGPLAGGGALGLGGAFLNVPWTLMESPEMRWSGYTFPDDALPDGRLLTDSKGRLHHVRTFRDQGSFTYMMSPTGGRGWGGERVELPGDLVVEDWDFKANAELGMAVVAIHAHDTVENVDQDLVFHLSFDDHDVSLEKVYFVGNGDVAASSGVAGGPLRFDFSTVGIMPGGQIVTSFLDRAHPTPAVAVLLDVPTRSDRTPPEIADLAARPTPFTPNGDGRGDKVRISFTTSERATVTVTVRKGRRTIATLLEGAEVEGRKTVSWDGDTPGGWPAPSGRYSFDVVAVDAAGNEHVATGVLRLRR